MICGPMRFFEEQGFKLHRRLVMLGLAIYKKMNVAMHASSM